MTKGCLFEQSACVFLQDNIEYIGGGGGLQPHKNCPRFEICCSLGFVVGIFPFFVEPFGFLRYFFELNLTKTEAIQNIMSPVRS